MKVNVISFMNNDAMRKGKYLMKLVTDKPVKEIKNYSKNRLDFDWKDPIYISYDKKLHILKFGEHELPISGTRQKQCLDVMFYTDGFPFRKRFEAEEIYFANNKSESFFEKIPEKEKKRINRTFLHLNKILEEKIGINNIFSISNYTYTINPLYIASSSLRDY